MAVRGREGMLGEDVGGEAWSRGVEGKVGGTQSYKR